MSSSQGKSRDVPHPTLRARREANKQNREALLVAYLALFIASATLVIEILSRTDW